MTATGLIDGCGADASQQNGTNILGISAQTLNAWAPAHVEAVAATTSAVAAQGGYVLGKVEAQLGVSTNAVLQVRVSCEGSHAHVSDTHSRTGQCRRAASPAMRR